MGRPLIWYLRRHPLLYKIRFKLVSKNVSSKTIEAFCYNDINPKTNVSSLFFETNELIFANSNSEKSDFEKAKTIAIWLKKNIKGGPGLGESSPIALQKMINGEGGVCSDFSQIYSNFCVINDIKVKEWGMKSLSQDPNFSGGHSFNEVYCNELQKWIMIDTAKSILFYQKNNAIPLSTLEYIQLKEEKKEIIVSTIVPDTVVDLSNINNIFFVSKSLPFVITNYNNKTVDNFLDTLRFLPESLQHGILFICGKGYTFEFPIEEN